MSSSPIYSSRVLKVYSAYISDRYPRIDVDELFKKAAILKTAIEDSGHWFTQQQVDAFHQAAVEIAGSADLSREVGRYTAFSNMAGAARHHVLGLLNVSSMYLLIARLYPLLSRAEKLKARKLSATKVEIIAESAPGVQERPYQCDHRLGLFESLPTLFTSKYATVVHDRCVHRGDPHCRYEVTWERPRHLFWKRCFWMGIFLWMSFLLISPWLLQWSAWHFLGMAVAAFTIGFGFLAGELERRELKRTIRKQGNVAEEHIKEVDYRYRGALLVQKIGQAASQIRDLEQLAQVVAENIQKFLDFDRGVVMLAGENRSRLFYAAGFGFDEEKAQLLRKTKFRLDTPKARGVFIKAFREERPILVDDVDALKDAFSSSSHLFAKQIGSKSLICLPLVYENQSLGILAVDNVKSKRQLAQSDVNLLMGVAYQTAASIFSSLAYKNLQASEERYRSLYDNAPTPYFSISADKAIPLYEPLNKIRAAGMRAAAIVRDLLTLARLGVQLTEVIDCNSLIGDFLQSPEFESIQACHPDVSVTTDLEDHLPFVKGSSVHLIKTLLNIVNNSAEAMPKGGKIQITTRSRESSDGAGPKPRYAGRCVMTEIRDEGEGIAREDIGRIFEPFFTRKTMGRSGTGLGMAIAWATVQDHKGTIEVESELGQGTTVTIFLPATSDLQAQAPVSPTIEELMGHGQRIMVIDEEIEHLEIAARMMRRLNYQVVAMSDAQGALSLLEAQPPELVLLDMMLGSADMDGLAIFERIRAVLPRQKVVFTSGYAETYRAKKALELGAGFVKKPFSLLEIAAAVRKELDSKNSITPDYVDSVLINCPR
jgi:signal transduction histidine kinase/ActR/RegA family two-component response regulator